MTNEELKELESKAYADYNATMKAIHIKCCLENNPYKVGDIIKDHIGFARIKRIIAPCYSGSGSRIPCCTYDCENLTKKLEVNKREPTRVVWQSNVITE